MASRISALPYNSCERKRINGENDGSEVPCEELRRCEGQVETRVGNDGAERRLQSHADHVPDAHGSLYGRTAPGSGSEAQSVHVREDPATSSNLPDLIELQKASFKWFISDGLRDAFDSISPIKDFTGNLVLEFGEHSLGEPKYSVEECRERDMTYSAPLRVRVRLITAESGEIKGIPDQEIFMGDFPLMTDKGTFMINGAERVIVSQLVRSPGVYFLQDADTNNRPTFNATIIPNRGAWIEFETDNGTKNDETEGTIGVRIDKNRKIYVDDVHPRALAARPRLRLGDRRSDPRAVRRLAADRELPRKRQGHQDQGRRAQGNLQEAASRRARERGERREAARVAVLR